MSDNDYHLLGDDGGPPVLGKAASALGSELGDMDGAASVFSTQTAKPSLKERVVHNRLGTLNGVFVPVSLNVMGVILFLRLSWAVGEAGWLGTMLLLLLAETQAVLTVMSLSAMVSNGRMKGGGSFYLIARSVGFEIGGSVGILFGASYTLSAAFYAIGFATEVHDTWFADNDSRWLLTGLSSAALFVMFLVAYGGAGSFTKINVWLFLIQFASIFISLGSMWFNHDVDPLENGGAFEGPDAGRLREHVMDEFSDGSDKQCDPNEYSNPVDPCNGMCSWITVYAIIFPAATGIMEGANLSGDLRSPGSSIGKGTLMAIAFAVLNYFSLVLSFGAGFSRETLQCNTIVMQDSCVSPYIIVVGVLVSSASSTLGALFGGSRILQALGKDRILPVLGFFEKGSLKGNEPRRAVIATWAVAQCCLFIGDLDVVAPLISSLFCLSYAMTNLACFLLAVSGTPNFRPRFKYFSWHTALLGFLLNIVVMFLLNWVGNIYT